ncbi:LysR family transcriptional regulator [Vibrio nigripulchritudo ATCC 27043]|uniref:LysR family transcriptional regulator n=1 Tax=Vibrio nigripulchritudo TaxID=28173 RepID=UPI00021C1B36|nr:LysR family transcriptional regulator [Vibrio nigripulchritudo]EGU61706.1 LysR family transcriptional regulator [Vibrio nigripulchritudo ATCC 27043]
MLNPIWLNTFKTLIDVGHFTKTAELLHMTQPGVSQHINKLEAACGYPLIRRFNKKFELTIYGRKVYDYAVKHFEEEFDLLQNLAHDEPFRGRCTIGCSGTFAWLIYSDLLSLQASYPDLSIELEATPNQRIFEQILQGKLDIGLVTKEPNPKYFSSRVIGAECLALVLPLSADESLPINELLMELGVVRHPDLAHYFQTYVNQANNDLLRLVDLDEVSTQSYINQVHQILVPIAKGIGFTVVPRWCVDLFAAKEQLKIFNITAERQEPVYLVSKLNSPLAKRYEQVIKVIENSFDMGEVS